MADPIQIGAPDGSVIEFPAGTPDSTIKVVMARNYPATGDASKLDPELAAAANSDAHPDDAGLLHSIRQAIHAPTRALENGALFGFGDRARALIDAGVGALGGNGWDYSGNLANERAQTEQFKADHPIASPVLEAVGGVGSLGVGKAAVLAPGATAPAAVPAVTKTLGQKVLAGARTGAGIGTISGVAGSKDWADLPQTIKGAAFGTGAGALLGGGLTLGAAGVGNGVNWLADAIRSTRGISKEAAAHLLPAVEAQGPQATQDALDRLGPDAMLADTGPALLGNAQGAALNSAEGRATLETALTNRNNGTNARLEVDRNAALGPADVNPNGQPIDAQTIRDNILAHRKAIDDVNYPAALDNAPDVQTAPILQALTAQIPRTVGMERKALTNLRDMMMTTEKRPRLDPFGRQEVNPKTGQPVFDDVPVSQNDAGVLHKVKGELDNVINYDRPGLGVPAGAVQNQQGSLKFFRGALNNTLENQVPGYREANAASHALANRAEAVQRGTQYLGSGKTTSAPGSFADEFNPLPQGEKIALGKGSRAEIERVFGTKANDLQALANELQGEGGWNTAKIATVHGQDAADQLVASLDRNKTFRDTKTRVVDNSQTAQRTAAAKAMKPDPSTEIPFFNPNSTLYGNVATGVKKAGLALANALLQKDPTKSYGEVAKILSAQGPEARAYLNALADTLSRRNASAAAVGRIADQSTLPALGAANGLLRDRLAARSNKRS